MSTNPMIAPRDLRVLLRRFDEPDEIRATEKGKYEVLAFVATHSAEPRTSRAGGGPSTSGIPRGTAVPSSISVS